MYRPRRVAGRLGAAGSTVILAGLAIGCGATSTSRTPPGAQAPLAAGGPGRLVVSGTITHGPSWHPVASVGGHVAVWIAQRSRVTLMRCDQAEVHLALHAGRTDPGGRGWTYGDGIGPREVQSVVAAFNGGFKLTYGQVGFSADGRAPVAIKPGLASLVTYGDGTSDIGAWNAGVPSTGKPVASVLQNLTLLVDKRRPAPTLATCVEKCWGATVGYLSSVARSALGVDSRGRLIWAAGEHLTPAAIAQALVSAGAVRALELDINPFWVAGYLYSHHGTRATAVPVVPGQRGIPGRLLRPYSRDFVTVLANG